MKTVALTLALVLPATAALSQSFQTALPLAPAERRAMETRLGAILDSAGTNEVNSFRLPTGRTLAVRTYRTVRRPGGSPCRGYRIDLEGAGERVAVDGFRCRRSDVNAWVIVEPEIVLAQDGAPLDLRGSTDEDPVAGRTSLSATDALEAEPPRQPDEPLYADDGSLFDEGEVPPVPRPAPPRPAASATVETGGAQSGRVAGDPAEGGPAPGETPAEESPGRIAQAALPALGDGDVPETVSGGEETQPRPTETSAESPVAAVDTEASGPTRESRDRSAQSVPRQPDSVRTRVVGERSDTAQLTYSGDRQVVSALKDLAYLSPGEGRPSAEEVRAAIDVFARDERFALPVSPDALLERLRAAVDRRDRLPVCAETAKGPCVVAD